MADEIDIVKDAIRSQPVDLESLLKKLGVKFSTEAMVDGESGRIEKCGPGEYRIVVNSREGAQRRRFTIAHELAHYLLHRDLLETGHLDRLYGAYASDNPSAPFSPSHEVQANQMAANILMPSKLIKQLHESGKTVDEIASKLEVSPAAMRIRFKTLNLDV